MKIEDDVSEEGPPPQPQPQRRRRLCHLTIWKLLLIVGIVVIAGLVVSQCFAFALLYGRTFSLYPSNKVSIVMVVRNATVLSSSQSNKSFVPDDTSDSGKETGYEKETKEPDKRNDPASVDKDDPKASTKLTLSNVQNQAGILSIVSQRISTNGMGSSDADSRTLDSLIADKNSVCNVKQTEGCQPKDRKMKPLQFVSITFNNNSTMTSISRSVLKRWEKQPISISQMNSILLNGHVSSHYVRPRWFSVRDRELLSAKSQIETAPVIRNTPRLYASLFRNVSTFKRSYDLMEHTLRIYIYREGEKPIFHQPRMRGIYASEGWFMKLIEGNKKFVVRDPRIAHLFYLPFSSQMLRTELSGKNIHGQKDLEKHLKNYIDLIAGKYRFWNRTGGVDRFLVACHDWASHVTRQHMSNCIRSLCNANVVKGFKIGKDTTLPVTYMHSVEDPVKDLGGRHPSQRYILAFFAGGMHGYVRPILLQYWENKEPDMKVFGPMPRDIEGKKIYREYMKSSKYCICARGYEVHTPRVVESIFYECVPVIISDNYVPPFFEVLNWEAFSVIIQEKDIPNLRNILLSIPQEKYLAMQLRVKKVQKHFLWHKKPVQYDLFHMVLHSVCSNVILPAALSVYWSDLKDTVAGLALVQSPYGGTPLASDILREGQIADKETRKIMEFLICKLIKGDIRALEDLTYEKRKEFIMKHKLPENIPLISFHSKASIAPGVLATMTHIAHAELPWLLFPTFGNEESDNVQAGRQVPVVIPLSAAMAVCALHLQLRYGEKSDGLVTCRDAEVPGSVVVRPDKKLDHAWMVYSSRKKNPSEPDACEMCEALLTLLVELGKMKQEARENSKD
nr:putative glycosyltransferase [Quercus suber]